MSSFRGIGKNNDWLVTPEMMRNRDPNGDLDNSDCFAVGITGKRYYINNLRKIPKPVTFVNLVPEPTNENDSSAIMVMSNGYKIGYVPARIAEWLHPRLVFLRASGVSCKVPVTTPIRKTVYSSFDDTTSPDSADSPDLDVDCMVGVMMLPTFRILEFLCPMDKVIGQFEEVWKELSEASKNEIEKAQFDFTKKSFNEFKRIGKNRTIYSFDIDASVDFDWILNQYLVFYRRIIRNITRDRNRLRRNIEILERSESENYTQIANTMTISPGQVGSIARKMKDPANYQSALDSLAKFPQTDEEITSYVLEHYFEITPETERWRESFFLEQDRLTQVNEKDFRTASMKRPYVRRKYISKSPPWPDKLPIEPAELTASDPHNLTAKAAKQVTHKRGFWNRVKSLFQ